MTSFRNKLLLICVLAASSCSANSNTEITLIGSTPGDDPIKSMLAISAGTKIDFIRWHLKLDHTNTFVLDITYGESQPNTLGFKNGGQKQTITGTYTIKKSEQAGRFREVYQLSSDGFPTSISLVKLNENVFHLLNPKNQLMNGNGGWSFSLNRKVPVETEKILISSVLSDEKSPQLVFDGRTPCQEIATEHPEMQATSSCFKLKWRLILNRDSMTLEPTNCIIRNIVDNQPRNIEGTWAIIKGIASNPDVIIYKIVLNNLADPILLLAGDDNVLFFLNKHNEPLIGNENFSFALNKKISTF